MIINLHKGGELNGKPQEDAGIIINKEVELDSRGKCSYNPQLEGLQLYETLKNALPWKTLKVLAELLSLDFKYPI
jgi:hypothetical protein